jgi:hypothetical protein
VAFFHSRKLNSAERNYPTHERELLAIHDCVRVWTHYIGGTNTTVFTDHERLQNITTQPNLSGRQARWMERLQSHHIDIVYIKGKDNVVADALSRRPDYVALNSLAVSGVASPGLEQELQQAALADAAYQALVARVQSGRLRGKQVVNGIVMSGSSPPLRVLVPADDKLKQQIMAECHDAPTAGHLGYKKTLDRVRQYFDWQGIAKDVKSYCRTCPVCMAAKAGNQRPLGKLHQLDTPVEKWESVAMDFITGLPTTQLGHDAIMTVTDRLTKMVRVIPTQTTATAPQTAKLFVDHVVRLYGVPNSIVSDRDSKFTSWFWKSTFALLGTKLRMSSSFHPETDGQSERTNQTVEQILRCYTNKFHDDWDTHVGLAEFSLNSATNISTGVSPFKLMYGYQPASPVDRVAAAFDTPSTLATRQSAAAADMISKMHADLATAKSSIALAQERTAKHADKHRREAHFEVGDRVMLSGAHVNLKGTSRKLKPRWLGPFTISKVVNKASVRLELPPAIRLHPVVHVSQIKPFEEDPRWEQRNTPPPPIVDDTGNVTYNVEQILAHQVERKTARQRKAGYKYLVKWEGYPLWE